MAVLTDFNVRLVYVLVMTLDKCANTYGSAPCTASLPAGSECYNTYPWCQDKANYDRSTVDLYFCTEKTMPFKGTTICKPYIPVGGVHLSPTSIQENRTERATLRVDMINEPDTKDILTDPYYSTRASISGTFWRKLIRRNPNMRGRPVKLYQGVYGQAFASYEEVFSGRISNVSMDEKGTVTLQAEDLMKVLKDINLPPAVDCQLSAAITDVSAQMTITNADQLPAAPHYVYIDDELIKYGAIDTGTGILSSLTRAQEGTTAAAHEEGEKVARVEWFDWDNPFDHMTSILTTRAGLAAGDVDSAAFTAAKGFPGGEPDMAAWVVKPTPALDLLFELVDLTDCKCWQSEDLTITIERNLPNAPGRNRTALTDTSDVGRSSRKVNLNEKSRNTRMTLNWDMKIGGKIKDFDSYHRTTTVSNANAESDNGYGDIREVIYYSRWLRNGNTAEETLQKYAANMLGRRLARTIEAQEIFEFDVHISRYAVKTGSYVDITTSALEDLDGSAISGWTFQVIKRTDKGAKIGLTCIRMPVGRIGFWQDASGAPVDFETATEAEREYAFWADGTTERVPDGTPEEATPFVYW